MPAGSACNASTRAVELATALPFTEVMVSPVVRPAAWAGDGCPEQPAPLVAPAFVPLGTMQVETSPTLVLLCWVPQSIGMAAKMNSAIRKCTSEPAERVSSRLRAGLFFSARSSSPGSTSSRSVIPTILT